MSKQLPLKFKILNMLFSEIKFASKYEPILNQFIVRCSTNFKRLGNTALVDKQFGQVEK